MTNHRYKNENGNKQSQDYLNLTWVDFYNNSVDSDYPMQT